MAWEARNEALPRLGWQSFCSGLGSTSWGPVMAGSGLSRRKDACLPGQSPALGTARHLESWAWKEAGSWELGIRLPPAHRVALCLPPPGASRCEGSVWQSTGRWGAAV